MAKIGYKFNPDTLSYDKIEITWKQRLARVLMHFVSSLSLAALMFAIFIAFVDSPKEKALKRENAELLAQYNIISGEIDRLYKVLKDLENRDDNIYRVIFESEPLDKTIRMAGSGGSNKYAHLRGISNADLVIGASKKLDNLEKAIYVQSKSYDEIEKLAKNKVEMMSSIPAMVPTSLKDNQTYISSGFGYRIHPIYKTLKLHAGMDFAGAIGTPIYATGNGTVSFAGFEKGYGKHVIINHGFNYETLYGHMNAYNVKRGQKVKRGDIIGYIGNTGLSYGPHVHYEVRKNGSPVNPINYYFNDFSADEYDRFVKEANNNGQTMD